MTIIKLKTLELYPPKKKLTHYILILNWFACIFEIEKTKTKMRHRTRKIVKSLYYRKCNPFFILFPLFFYYVNILISVDTLTRSWWIRWFFSRFECNFLFIFFTRNFFSTLIQLWNELRFFLFWRWLKLNTIIINRNYFSFFSNCQKILTIKTKGQKVEQIKLSKIKTKQKITRLNKHLERLQTTSVWDFGIYLLVKSINSQIEKKYY